MSETKKIILKKNEDNRLRKGHLWIFSNEIFKTEGNPENGELVELYNSKDEFLGTGFYNKNSLISFRFLSKNKIENLKEEFRKKVLSAYNLRKEFYPERNSFRLIFSESDFMPGIIIDKYNQTFVLQIYSYGMQKNIDLINEILKEDLNAENIFSKNENYFRMLEGLPQQDEIYFGEMKTEFIDDGKIKYKIDFEKSHKTGFYFDQADNRNFVEKICKDKTFLDAFCNSGGFGFHAIKSGASKVQFVDASSFEIENVKTNLALNDFEISKCEFITEDVFDHFEKLINQKIKFDIVNVDPPAFAKNKKSLPQAKKGYEKLNRQALQLINENGYLVTSSCSFHLSQSEFLDAVNSAAVKSKRQIQLIHFNEASLDHPKILAMPETSYLKFAVFKVY